MFLEAQKYLAANGLLKLQEEFKIESTLNSDKSLIILNYSHIDKQNKFHPIVRECRGLVLENNTWKVVGNNFRRFYNFGECPEDEAKFDWNNCVCEEKIDGSLINLFYYNDRWQITTRASFAEGCPNPDSSKTWLDLFEEALTYKLNDEFLFFNPDFAYQFELGTPLTQVVVRFDKPTLFLLNAKCNFTGREMTSEGLDRKANYLGVKRPQSFPFNNTEAIKKYFAEAGLKGNEFEGVVFKDINGNRIKLKYKGYLELHRLKGNGNLFLLKNLIPLMVKESDDLTEASLYFAGLREKIEILEGQVYILKKNAEHLWNRTKDFSVQKDFALAVKDTPFASIMFLSRKNGFEEAWKESGDFIYEKFFRSQKKDN